jgi:hypothetical protein
LQFRTPNPSPPFPFSTIFLTIAQIEHHLASAQFSRHFFFAYLHSLTSATSSSGWQSSATSPLVSPTSFLAKLSLPLIYTILSAPLFLQYNIEKHFKKWTGKTIIIHILTSTSASTFG